MSRQPAFDPPAPAELVAHASAADHAANHQPVAGTPSLRMPSAPVGGPVDAQKINAFFGIGALVLLVVTVAVMVLLAISVLNLITPR